jgi:hypothetical protein
MAIQIKHSGASSAFFLLSAKNMRLCVPIRNLGGALPGPPSLRAEGEAIHQALSAGLLRRLRLLAMTGMWGVAVVDAFSVA